MITEQEYTALLEKCRTVPPTKSNYLESDFVRNVFLTVLDFQMHFNAVENAMAYYHANCEQEIRTFEDLRVLLSHYTDDKEGNSAVAQYLWGNCHWTRVALMRRFLIYLGSIGVTTQERLVEWAQTSDFKRDFEGKVKGMGYAIYQWLVMRQGIETVKPDVHLHKFVKAAVGHSVTDKELVRALERVARDLDLKAYELDWRIWEHEKARSTAS